jgi:hypothetical protein
VDGAAAGETSGYVHQDVDLVETGDDGGGQLVGVAVFCEIGCHGSEIGLGEIGGIDLARCADHLRAGPQKRPRHVGAQPAFGAGN